MANSIVGGLFGVDPMQMMQARQLQEEKAALAQAQLSPMENVQYGAIRTGQQLGNVFGGLMGVQDPQLQAAAQAKQLSTQFDLTTAKGITDFAKALSEAGNPLAYQVAQQAMVMGEKEATIGYRKAQAEKLAQPSSKVGKMIEERDALARMYGENDPRVQAIDQVIYKEGYIKPAKGKGGGDGGVGGSINPDTGLYTPKAIGKAGAFQDAFGMVHSAAAMKDLNKDIAAMKNLNASLDAVSLDDIKQASSMIDTTQMSGTAKAVAAKVSPQTVSAQSRLAALQLREQIQNLPPGPASDKDMRAAAASFPGYGDSAALEKWVKDTRAVVRRKLSGYQEQFGAAAGKIPTQSEDNGDPLGIRKGKTK